MKRALIIVAIGLSACKGHVFHPPNRDQQAAEAAGQYSSQLFDTIQWASNAAKLSAGNEVYARECDKCHGTLGAADTPYDRDHNIKAPALIIPDWKLANDREAVRKKVFTGHKKMPTWGVAHLSPREIDAVTSYVLEQLRPDALKKR